MKEMFTNIPQTKNSNLFSFLRLNQRNRTRLSFCACVSNASENSLPSSFQGGYSPTTSTSFPPWLHPFFARGVHSLIFQSDDHCRVFWCENKETGICIPFPTPRLFCPAMVSHHYDGREPGFVFYPFSPPLPVLPVSPFLEDAS